MSGFRGFLYWLVGADANLMKDLPRATGLKYESLGWIFLLNFCLLLGAWGSVGWHFFGGPGLIAPGLLIPGLFLAFDRLVAQLPRKLKGSMAAFNVPGTTGTMRLELGLRVLMALVLTSCTTFTFMTSQAAPIIQAKAQELQIRGNAPLIEEGKLQVNNEFSSRKSFLDQDISNLSALQKSLEEQTNDVRTLLFNFEQKATNAQSLAFAEEGGLDGRAKKCGSKCRAYKAQADLFTTRADALRKQLTELSMQFQQVNTKLSSHRAELAGLSQARTQRLADVVNAIPSDPRYMSMRRGLFADASNFILLFRDPALAPGMGLIALLAGSCLFVLECAALLGLSIFPSSTYELKKLANQRETAQRIVVETENRLADLSQIRPDVDVAIHGEQSAGFGVGDSVGESSSDSGFSPQDQPGTDAQFRPATSFVPPTRQNIDRKKILLATFSPQTE